MATNTYVALDKVTVGTETPSITFTGISGAYTDLVIVMSAKSSLDGRDFRMRFNGDTAANYSSTFLSAYTSATSGRAANASYIQFNNLIGSSTVVPTATIINIMNYSNTTTFKTALIRHNQFQTNVNSGYSETMAQTSSWRKTPEAITSITIYPHTGNMAVGSTFSLYGIAAQATPGTAKATGGTITYDNFGRVIHTFTSSGTFTPTQSLTNVEYLVVAGGGGGAGDVGGGGGAGGLRSTTNASGGGPVLETPLSLSSSTPYTVTIGAGGAGGVAAAGSQGSNSVFSTITSLGGGYGGRAGTYGNAGGSGGGGSGRGNVTGYIGYGGAGTANQGYEGGFGRGDSSVNGQSGGGGGGAGAVGSYSLVGTGGNGGSGVTVLISGSATTYAGGGGGAVYTPGTNGTGGAGGGGNAGNAGTTNTGGGGGGSIGGSTTGGAGGSGIVIIRYQG